MILLLKGFSNAITGKIKSVESNLTDLFGNAGVPGLVKFSCYYFVDCFNQFAENFTPNLHQFYINKLG